MNPVQKYILSQYKRCAEKRGYAWDLEDTTAIKIMGCACVYCGMVNSNKATRTRKSGNLVFFYNGIDRVNSDLPYTDGNTVACCKACNAAKSARTYAEFVSSDWLRNRIAMMNGE